MKAKILRILFCIFILMGTLLENSLGEKEKREITILMTPGEIHETENAFMKVAEAISKARAAEEFSEAENSFGLPLMDDTVLLVTVEKCHSSYEFISEEYEYDSEGRLLRHLRDGIIDYNDREYEYDAQGRCMKESRYNVSGKEKILKTLKSWVDYSYGKDEAGQPIRTEREYHADGSLYKVCVYDSEEKRLKETTYRESRLLRSEYEYDTSKQQQWLTEYDQEGHVERRYRKDYDDMGNEILHALYDGEGNLILDDGDCDCGPDEYYIYWRFENKYDEAGNLILQTGFDEKDHQTGYTENTYDDHGNLVKEVRYDAENAIIYYVENTYDEKDNLVCRFSFSEYDEPGKTGFVYDASGRCTQMWKTHCDYEEDEEGNPTKDSIHMIWEKEYDDRGRLIKYTDDNEKRWYNYIYTAVGDFDEDDLYDRIKVR